jgi:hypothetical protein
MWSDQKLFRFSIALPAKSTSALTLILKPFPEMYFMSPQFDCVSVFAFKRLNSLVERSALMHGASESRRSKRVH